MSSENQSAGEEPGFRDWVKRGGLLIERKSIYKRRTDLKRRQTSKAAEGLNSGAGRTLCAQVLGMKTASNVFALEDSFGEPKSFRNISGSNRVKFCV